LTFKATVEQAHLLKCLGRVYRVVERKNTIPILSNVLMQIEQDRIVFRATDLDIVVGDSVKAEVAAKGNTTVPAHLFHDIVRKMPLGSQIVIEQTANGISVKSGRSRFTLQTLPENDFPDLTVGEIANTFVISGKDLHRLIDRSSFAISTEETRYYLNGIYFHVAQQGNVATLRAVATDGHRLAQVELSLPEGAGGMPGIIIPRKTVGEVSRLFSPEDEIQVEVSQGKIRFSVGDVSLHSKLIDGTFPDYGRVIPQNNEKIVTLDRKDFVAAADRVATVSSDRGRAMKMSLENGKVVLSVSNPDSGTATEEMEVEYTGEPLDVGFNSRYVSDILGQVEGDKVTLKLNDPGSPALVTGGDEGSLFVLMPMRV
jgi:DNA polymerase-3 subunit beta